MMRVITGCHQRNHNMNEQNTSGNRQRKQSRNWKPYPGDRTVIRGKAKGKYVKRPKIPEAVEQQAMERAEGVEAQTDGRLL